MFSIQIINLNFMLVAIRNTGVICDIMHGQHAINVIVFRPTTRF